MESKMIVVVCCIFVVMVLTGCEGLLDSGSSSFSTASTPTGGIGDDDPAGDGAGDDGDNPGGDTPYNPEPATVALLGGGLLAYAFMRRRKRK